MRPYSVEIYSTDFTLKSHNTVDFESYEYKFDYLDPEQNKIKVLKPIEAKVHDYIRVFGNERDIFGYISKTEHGDEADKDLIDVTFYDMLNKMDIDFIVDTSTIGSGYLEDFIAAAISQNYISNQDEEQNIGGLTTEVRNRLVDSWTLDITPDDGETRTKANLLDDIILAAFRRYSVSVEFRLDLAAKEIIASIGTNTQTSKLIESSLPNVFSKTIKVRQAKKEINKDIVANKKDYNSQRIYFLHNDGTFSTEDANRVLPVYSKVETVSTKTKEEYIEKYVSNLTKDISTIKKAQEALDKGEELDPETIEKEKEAASALNATGLSITIDDATGRASGFDAESAEEYINNFAETDEYKELCNALAEAEFIAKADEKACKTFGANKYENLIEIECANDDQLIKPYEMDIGQLVRIYEDGTVYETILTGRKTKETTTLIFGNERMELTKILKGRN